MDDLIEEAVQVCQHRTGWCMTGDHGGCPLIFGGGQFPDPSSKKGATYTTPTYMCPCACHDRSATVAHGVETNQRKRVTHATDSQHDH